MYFRKDFVMGKKEALAWMDRHHRHKCEARYSMYTRYGNPNYDCSSAVIYALIAGGVLPKDSFIGNTETLFSYRGKYLDEVYNFSDVRAGDIFIRGGEGTSLGANGHTGMFSGDGMIVHCNYSYNGISYNPCSEFLDCRRSWNERYFRPRYDGKASNTGDSRPIKPTVDGVRLVKNESWKGVTQAVCNVRSEPSTRSAIVATYGMGQTIYYDRVYEGNGYRWISYVGYSGKRRYVAYRRTDGDTTPWIKF